jgi:hypothetical protein
VRYLSLVALACFAGLCTGTIIKEVGFEDLVASSNQIVAGHVTRSWTSWGSDHKFIWTRYEVAVDDVLAGPQNSNASSTVVVSEPGGVLDGKAMSVESAVRYTTGEHVVLFLHQFPSGDKRTVGWSQGKFTIDAGDRVQTNGARMASLNGITYTELRQRIAALSQRSAAK